MQKQFPSGQFTLDNTAYTTTTLVQALQSLIDAINAVNTAQANAKEAVATMGATVAKVGPIVSSALQEQPALTTFGSATTTLALVRPGAPQGSGAAHGSGDRDRRGEGGGHAHRAWDGEQEEEAHRLGQRDRDQSDPDHVVHRRRAVPERGALEAAVPVSASATPIVPAVNGGNDRSSSVSEP